jgi:NAD(P)-dependent dehydrogenase (short-subunit alcohol dehydrogenase family)
MSQTVVITGGSKGIGWEIVQAFAGKGFYVVSGSRTIRSDVPKKIAHRIKQIEIDVKNKKDHYKLVAEANNWSGSLDCYINNAGYSEWKELKNIDEKFLTNLFETNLFSYFWGAQAAASTLSKGGSIINISSLAAKRGTTNNSAYSATKFGVTALTQSLCKELGKQGIRVNAVCPVLIDTPGLLTALKDGQSPSGNNAREYLKNFAVSQTALGRLPTASEVAKLCLFLSSKDASGITGQSINVDCGVLPN